VVCLITPECIFLLLVIPVSVCSADDLILSLCILLHNYPWEDEDNRIGTADMIGGYAQDAMRHVIKKSQLIGFFHDKAQSSHTLVRASHGHRPGL